MAAASENLTIKIDLLRHQETNPQMGMKITSYLLSTGKYILILVEVVVIGALIARYKLDADMAYLQDQIEQKSAYLKSIQNDEAVVKQFQFQISSAQQTKASRLPYTELLQQISSATPTNIILSGITFEKAQDGTDKIVSISGNTPTILEISAYLKSLKQNASLQNVTLTNLSFDTETKFTIVATIVKSAN